MNQVTTSNGVSYLLNALDLGSIKVPNLCGKSGCTPSIALLIAFKAHHGSMATVDASDRSMLMDAYGTINKSQIPECWKGLRM